MTYGRHVTAQRLHDDVSLRDQLLDRFERSATASSTERLLKTPLQVLILTFILETFGDLPANRYELFSSYYETVYRREIAKPTTYRTFLQEHRDDITELHERVGLVLQVHLEGTDETRARLPRADLHRLASDRMREVGHDDIREAARLANQIVDIATTRLVLLAADEDETVSFDVRSLQELMAARALVKGDDEAIRRNLVLAAPSHTGATPGCSQLVSSLPKVTTGASSYSTSSSDSTAATTTGPAGCIRSARNWRPTYSTTGWPQQNPPPSGCSLRRPFAVSTARCQKSSPQLRRPSPTQRKIGPSMRSSATSSKPRSQAPPPLSPWLLSSCTRQLSVR